MQEETESWIENAAKGLMGKQVCLQRIVLSLIFDHLINSTVVDYLLSSL